MSRAKTSSSNEEEKLLELLNTVQKDLNSLEEFSRHYDYNLGIGLLEAALSAFEPVAEQHQKDHNSLPPGYVSLIMFYINGRVLSVVPDAPNKTVEYVRMLVEDQENLARACMEVTVNAGDFTMAQLFEVVKLQQPERNVEKFKPEILDIINIVLRRENLDEWNFGGLSEPVKELVLWALKLCTAEATTGNAALEQIIETVNRHCTTSTAILELVLCSLEQHDHAGELLKHAACLGGKLVNNYMTYLLPCITSLMNREELERYLKNAMKSCHKYSSTGLGHFVCCLHQILQRYSVKSDKGLQAIIYRVLSTADDVRNTPRVFSASLVPPIFK
eukprot:GHVU01107763.1.p1 GENE.GHVU01107763.1~~GHVU01107763.1.p1  ORF type:complete len:332 (-),score=35.74 GHVU01107763.1:410-1405(-)